MSKMWGYVLFIFTQIASLQLCGAKGTLSLKLIHYKNPDGKLLDGTCCDSYLTIWCSADPCDPYFTLCLDEPYGSPTDINQCRIGTYDTNTVWHKSEITFGKIIGTIPNPKDMSFDTWMGGTRLKINAWETDPGINPDEIMEFFTIQVWMQASRSRAERKWKDFQVKGRTQLKLRMAVFCDDNWFGSKCDVYCKPSANCKCSSFGDRDCECSNRKWGSNCELNCNCKDTVACNIDTGKCPNEECAPGWKGSTCNETCGLPYYRSCDLKHSAPQELDIIGDYSVQSSVACFQLCETNKKNGCITLDIIHQNDGSLQCKLMKQKGKSTCLTDSKVKHYVQDYFPKTCSVDGTLPDNCQGEYKFVGWLCDDEPVYEQTNGEHIIYHVRSKKWVCTSVDSDMSECNGSAEAETPGDRRDTMAGSWGNDSYAICH